MFSKIYHRRTIAEVFAAIRKDGIRDVQFNFECVGLDPLPDRVDERLMDEILDAMHLQDICIASVSGTFNMINKDETRLEEDIRRFGYLCELSERLGAKVITLCTGSRNADKWKWDDENLEPGSYELLKDTARKILGPAHQHGIYLAVEPEPSNIIYDHVQARRFLDDMDDDHLKIVMDGANLFSLDNIGKVDETIKEAFRLLGRDVVLAHGKDVQEKDGTLKYCGSGLGIVDFPLFGRLLKEYGYEGPVVMHGLNESEVRRCAAYLEELG